MGAIIIPARCFSLGCASAIEAPWQAQGRGFVRIHRLREHLGWPRERFDQSLQELWSAYIIKLHDGNASQMTEEEIRSNA